MEARRDGRDHRPGVIRAALSCVLGTTLGRSLAGVSAALGLDEVGVVTFPEAPGELSLILVGSGLLVALQHGGYRALGYMRTPREDGVRLARAMRYHGALALFLVLSGVVQRLRPNGGCEFWLAVFAYAGLVVIGGRITVLSTRLSLSSLSASILRSPCAHDLHEALTTWIRSEKQPSPPAITPVRQALGVTTAAGKASVFMSILATAVAGVAFANAGPAIRGAAGAIRAAGEGSSVIGITAVTSTTAARTSTPAAVPTQTAPVAVPAQPTYADLCPDASEPGKEATPPQSAELRSLWLGSSSGPGVGALVAGCPEPAAEVRPGSGVWFAPGRCGGDLRSIGISTGDGSPALVLAQAAQFTLGKAIDGTLVEASRRTRVRGGDAYVIDTTIGSYVLVRARVVTRSAPGSASRSHCAAIVQAGNPYTVLPPAIVVAWLTITRDSWTWPEVDRTGHAFAFRDAGGTILATGLCTTDEECRVVYGTRVLTGSGGAHVLADQLIAAAQ